MEPVYEVVWPKSPRGAQRRRAAARLDSLEGKRVAFMWDYLFRGEELFPVLEMELRRRYPTIDIVSYDVIGNIHGPDEAAIVGGLGETLRAQHIDAVVCGNGC